MKHLLTLLLLITFNANAEFTIKFGGWSKHESKYFIDNSDITYDYTGYFELDAKQKDLEYNESHNGLGFDYKAGDGNLKYIFGAWYMKDSFNKDSIQIGAGVSYKINKYFDVNLAVTYFNRTIVVKKSTGRGFVYDYKIKRTEFVYPLPYVTINLTEKLNMDIMALINPFEGGDSVIFARLGYTF